MTHYSNFFSFQCALYDPCWNNSACLNTAPGYQCLACPHGFYSGTYEDGLSINNTVRVFELRNEVLSPIQDQTCVDINECLTNNGGCDPNAPCVNTIVSSCKKGNHLFNFNKFDNIHCFEFIYLVHVW